MIGRREIQYQGYHLGGGKVRPQVAKTAAVVASPRPRTKKEVRRFLGLAGYYRQFVPHFSDLASPLTDLDRPCPDPAGGGGRPADAIPEPKTIRPGGSVQHGVEGESRHQMGGRRPSLTPAGARSPSIPTTPPSIGSTA